MSRAMWHTSHYSAFQETEEDIMVEDYTNTDCMLQNNKRGSHPETWWI